MSKRMIKSRFCAACSLSIVPDAREKSGPSLTRPDIINGQTGTRKTLERVFWATKCCAS